MNKHLARMWKTESGLGCWFASMAVGLLLLWLPCPGAAQSTATNLTTGSQSQTNGLPRLRSPNDYQRLKYYYAAALNSPAPGTEHHLFTIGANQQWNGDWTSTVVAAPTRSQLQAITPVQYAVFRQAAAYTNGAWQVTTPSGTIPLSSLATVSPATYQQILWTGQRNHLQWQLQQLNKQLSNSSTVTAP